MKPFTPGSGLFDLLKVPSGGILILAAQPAKFGSVKQALEAYHGAGARLLVTLLPDHELNALGLQAVRESCEATGLPWAHCPIEDFSAPGLEFERGWRGIASRVHSLLDRGEGVALHCRAGLGRTGTVAARVLMERGLSAKDAIHLVRQTRSGSIETAAQEDYLQHYASISMSAKDGALVPDKGVPG